MNEPDNSPEVEQPAPEAQPTPAPDVTPPAPEGDEVNAPDDATDDNNTPVDEPANTPDE